MATSGPGPLRLWRGGLFYRAEARLGVVRDDRRDPLRQAALFAALAWLPQLVLGALELAGGSPLPGPLAVTLLEATTRWLLAAPLLLVGVYVVGRGIDEALHHLVETGMVSDPDRARLERTTNRVGWLRDWWGVDLLLLSGALAMGGWLETTGAGRLEVWSTAVAMPLFRFLILRWLWQWLLWAVLLGRIATLDLRLVASHPDEVAGLRFLARPARLSSVAVAGLGTLLCGVWASQMVLQDASLASLSTLAAVYVILVLVVKLAPLLLLARPILRVREAQYHEYDRMARAQSEAFHERWVCERHPPDPGHADFQSMADLGEVYRRATMVRAVPLAMRDVYTLVAATALPLLPLLLLAVPLEVLLGRLFEALI